MFSETTMDVFIPGKWGQKLASFYAVPCDSKVLHLAQKLGCLVRSVIPIIFVTVLMFFISVITDRSESRTTRGLGLGYF